MSECTARRQPEAMANYKCLFFLDVGHDALRPSEYSIQSHMVSYCSAIKFVLSKLQMIHLETKGQCHHTISILLLPIYTYIPHMKPLCNYFLVFLSERNSWWCDKLILYLRLLIGDNIMETHLLYQNYKFC